MLGPVCQLLVMSHREGITASHMEVPAASAKHPLVHESITRGMSKWFSNRRDKLLTGRTGDPRNRNSGLRRSRRRRHHRHRHRMHQMGLHIRVYDLTCRDMLPKRGTLRRFVGTAEWLLRYRGSYQGGL